MLRVLAVGVALGLSAVPAAAGEMVGWSYSALGSVDGEFYVSGVPFTAVETEIGVATVINPVTGYAPATGFTDVIGTGVRLPVTVTLTDAASGEAGTVALTYVLKSTSEDAVTSTLESFDPVILDIGGLEYAVAADAKSSGLTVQVNSLAIIAPPEPVVDPAPTVDDPIIMTTTAPPGVPEPATGLLALVGVAGVAVRRWRR